MIYSEVKRLRAIPLFPHTRLETVGIAQSKWYRFIRADHMSSSDIGSGGIG
jgi:hypothetical protein